MNSENLGERGSAGKVSGQVRCRILSFLLARVYSVYFLEPSGLCLDWRVVVYLDLVDGDTEGRVGLCVRVLGNQSF